MIRHATLGDRAALIELTDAFIVEVGYDDATDTAAFVVDRCLRAAHRLDPADGLGGMLVIDNGGVVDGFFGFVIGDHPITGEVVAFELAWFVCKPARRGTQGIRLLLEAQTTATALGAHVLQVSALDDRLGRFLQAHQFRKRESTYTLDLIHEPNDRFDIP